MIVAVTGNTGSGKSAVSRLFEKWGATRIDADEIGRSVWKDDKEIQSRIIALFGEAVLTEGGSVDRRKLGKVVFSRKENLQAFDAIVQPILRERIARMLRDARNEGGPWVLDAALLFEWGHRDLVDRVVAVVGAGDIRAARIAARDGITPEAARERIEAQQDEEGKARAADYIIRNEGTFEELEEKTRRVWDTLFIEKGDRYD